MSDEEIAFDDWEKEAELMTVNNAKEEVAPLEEIRVAVKDNPEQLVDAHKQHLIEIERIKKMNQKQFNQTFLTKNEEIRHIEPFSAILMVQKEFVELANIVADHFKTTALQSPQKVLPQSEIITFFEQFLLYLYPNIQWESIQAVKEKTKIVKKEKKEQEARARKIREKEMRLKRGFNKQQVTRKQSEQSKPGHNQNEYECM